MTDRWRPHSADDAARQVPAGERRHSPPTIQPGPSDAAGPHRSGQRDSIQGPDGGLDSGRGFGRIGVSRSDPWSGERGPDAGARGPWAYSRREDYTGRGPKNYQRPDQRILEDVCDRLTDDAMVDASEISVEVQQGDVTLNGTVRDRDQKRRAEDLAERVSGVRDVINAMRIAAGKPGP